MILYILDWTDSANRDPNYDTCNTELNAQSNIVSVTKKGGGAGLHVATPVRVLIS